MFDINDPNVLYFLDQEEMGGGAPVQYRAITANPVEMGEPTGIEVGVPAQVPFKAPDVKSTPIPESVRKKMGESVGVATRPLTDAELEAIAKREDDANHSTDVLVGSLERLSNTLSNRNNDNMLYNSARGHSAEQIRKREKKLDRSIAEMKALAPIAKAEEKSALQRALEDLNSPQSKRAQDAFITSGLASALKLSDEQIRGMSASELESVRKNVGSSQDVLLNAQKYASGERKEQQEQTAQSALRGELINSGLSPAEADLVISGGADFAQERLNRIQKARDTAARLAEIRATRELANATRSQDKIDEGVVKLGKELEPVKDLETNLVEIGKISKSYLDAGKTLPHLTVTNKVMDTLGSVSPLLGGAIKGINNTVNSDPNKILLEQRTRKLVADALKLQSGATVTEAEVTRKMEEYGMIGNAATNDTFQAGLNRLLEDSQRTIQSKMNNYPEAVRNSWIQRHASSTAPSPAATETPRKTAPTGGAPKAPAGKKVVRKQYNAALNKTRITYEDGSVETVDGKR